MAPIRIRGKRTASAAEKWHAGKQRKAVRTGSTTPSERSSRAQSTSSSTKSLSRQRRRRHNVNLSPLEELPTEVLHSIFEYAVNFDMPLASPQLATQLASAHLCYRLTSRILRPVLGGKNCTSAESAAVARLMDSKFFTWTFFRDWLHGESERLDLLRNWEREMGSKSADMTPNQQANVAWHDMGPPFGLAPPTKLFRGPFTEDNIMFLRMVNSPFRQGPVGPFYRELVREGLDQAISEGAKDALPIFWCLIPFPDIELLRHAVIDSGCNKEVVQEIIARAQQMRSNLCNVDFLDPALWSWADKARAGGNEKGVWLVSILKDAARRSGRKDVEIRKADAIVIED